MQMLYLADEDGMNPIHLHGSLISPPVVGARRQDTPKPIQNGLVEEVIDIAVQGTGIQSFIQAVEEKISLSRSRVHDTYVFILAEGRTSEFSTRVLDGRVELLGGGLNDRARDVQTLRLHLLRADYWEESKRPLNLSNQNGTGVWDGLAIRNHCDAAIGHQNFVVIPAEQAGGGQPCPLDVQLILPDGFIGALRDVYIAAGFDLGGDSGGFDHVLEGEAGAPGSGCTASTQTADAGCSEGYFERVEWSAADEIALWKWTLDAACLAYMKGGLFRPILRLASQPPAGIYLRWSVSSQSGVGELLRTQQALLEPGRRLAALPALCLPPDDMGGGPYAPLEIQLLAECAAAGTKALDIDFVQLLPGGSFQHLIPLSGLTEGYTLVSDGYENKVYAAHTSGGSRHLSHALVSSPILVQPGRANRIYFLFETDAGAPIDALAQVRVLQKPRWGQP